MTDYKSLCAELVAIVAEEYGHTNEYKSGRPLDVSNVSGLLTRARAALAQPEPPAEGEVAELCCALRDEWLSLRMDQRNRAADLLERLAEPDGPAVPKGREPASVAEDPTDAELLELMPQQFRADLAMVSRLAAHGTSLDVTPGLFRVSLNTGALDYARAVLARWGRP